MLTAAFVSAVLGNTLPGPGTIYLSQTLKFRRPVRIGDIVRVEVEVLDYDEAAPRHAARRRGPSSARRWCSTARRRRSRPSSGAARA